MAVGPGLRAVRGELAAGACRARRASYGDRREGGRRAAGLAAEPQVHFPGVYPSAHTIPGEGWPGRALASGGSAAGAAGSQGGGAGGGQMPATPGGASHYRPVR